MRARLKPVFAGFNLDERSTLAALIERSQVLPPSEAAEVGSGAGRAAAMGDEGSGPLHIFADSEFQPTGIFLNHLRDEVAQEMELLFEQEDHTQFPSSSENFCVTFAEAIAANNRLGSAGKTEEPRGCKASGEAGGGGGAAASELPAGGASGLQRKFVPLAPPLPPDEDRAAAMESAVQRRRLPLVMVASLVDKTPNLAGLCRTCEVFNCEAVCLANSKITRDPSFQSISVTAEKWLPIREVPRAAVRDYLLEMRAKGYAIVGIEQTHCSRQLDEFHFQPNTVLVLGAEKEGIDAELLPLMDACVEIPQAGQLRSLNVHVSGSLVVWEYTRQLRAATAAK